MDDRNGVMYSRTSKIAGDNTLICHDEVIKSKHFHYWPFVRGIHRSPVEA